jgi:hypothetical protein
MWMEFSRGSEKTMKRLARGLTCVAHECMPEAVPVSPLLQCQLSFQISQAHWFERITKTVIFYDLLLSGLNI